MLRETRPLQSQANLTARLTASQSESHGKPQVNRENETVSREVSSESHSDGASLGSPRRETETGTETETESVQSGIGPRARASRLDPWHGPTCRVRPARLRRPPRSPPVGQKGGDDEITEIDAGPGHSLFPHRIFRRTE